MAGSSPGFLRTTVGGAGLLPGIERVSARANRRKKRTGKISPSGKRSLVSRKKKMAEKFTLLLPQTY